MKIIIIIVIIIVGFYRQLLVQEPSQIMFIVVHPSCCFNVDVDKYLLIFFNWRKLFNSLN